MTELRVPTSDLIPGRPVRVPYKGRRAVCVVRVGDGFHAVDDRCSHADVSLSEGDVDEQECWIECWKHGSAFSLLDGRPQSLPATVPVAVYPVRVEGDHLVVEVP